MNNLGQAQIFGILFAVVGAIMGYTISGSMDGGLIIKFITTICCGLAGYFIPMAVSSS